MCVLREGKRAKTTYPFINILGPLLCGRLSSGTWSQSSKQGQHGLCPQVSDLQWETREAANMH